MTIVNEKTVPTPSAPSASGRLAGKVAFISGGGTGIGKCAAGMFAREGAAVVIADMRGDAAQAVADDIIRCGGRAAAFSADVTREAEVAEAFAAAARQFGRLDILFNCAGGSLPQDAPIADVDMEVWDKTMSVDLKGTMLCCRHAIPLMIASGGGAIVNMSSGAGLRGSSKSHIYTAAKGAIISFTRALAGTYAAKNIRANAICSGRVNTERVRQAYGMPGQPGKFSDPMNVDEQIKTYPFWVGEPEDIGYIAVFLASNESRMITGAAIPADGGRSAY